MGIRFERREKLARYLDPRAGYTETAIPCEIRRDPLTGRSGRIAHVAGFHLEPVDFTAAIAASRASCPFCPERILAVTPKFIPSVVAEGRIQRGEAVLFPNLSPYDEHSVVAAITRDHFVPLDQFTPRLLLDAHAACLDYFRQVQRLPETIYKLIFWNYLPASGGTQIHPHLQAFATDTPGTILEEELAASARYVDSGEGSCFWDDLAREEERLGERFIARGEHTVWLASFVSRSLLGDVLALFPARQTLLDLPERALEEFCHGAAHVLGQYAAQGVYSFNLAWMPGIEGRDDFWLHVRLSPRLYLTPRIWGADTTALQHLYAEHFMVWTPEAVAQTLRASQLQQALVRPFGP